MKDQVRLVLVHRRDADVAQWIKILTADTDIVVVWHCTIEHALRGMRDSRADIVAMDVTGATEEMVFVETIMSDTPIPIILMCPELPDPIAQRLMVAGALEAVRIPNASDRAAEDGLRKSLRLMAQVRVVHRRSKRAPKGNGKVHAVVGIAASTGGPEALSVVLGGLAGVEAPVLIVQHINAAFLAAFVEWMNSMAPVPVMVAQEGETPAVGNVYVAPNHVHLGLDTRGRIALYPATSQSLHIPSANALFTSLAEVAGPRAIGVILTGMGSDGAEGLKRIGMSGGYTIVQDEATSTVFGMGRAAVELTRVSEVLPLQKVGAAVQAAASRIRQ